MKSFKFIAPVIFGLALAACQPPPPVYVPVYVPTEQKVAPKKVTYTPKPSRPVESAEGFRAVEKPTTYSN
jgi:hypothetical protein